LAQAILAQGQQEDFKEVTFGERTLSH